VTKCECDVMVVYVGGERNKGRQCLVGGWCHQRFILKNHFFFIVFIVIA